MSVDIYELLHEMTEVEAVAGDRIFPSIMKSETYPAIVFQLVGTSRSEVYCGVIGLVRGSYQVDVYSRAYSETNSLANIVRRNVSPFKGVVAGTRIRHCSLTTDFDSVDVDPGLFRRTQQWDIWFEE